MRIKSDERNEPLGTLPPDGRLSWRDYQARLQNRTKLKRTGRRVFTYGILPLAVLIAVYGLLKGHGPVAEDRNASPYAVAATDASPPSPGKLFASLTAPRRTAPPLMPKTRVRALLSAADFVNLEEESLEIVTQGQILQIDTSLDSDLQQYMIANLDRKHARHIGIVAMEPKTGKVRVMVGLDKTASNHNPCTETQFPAASIFKIVTATAAIEVGKIEPDTELTYNGRKHTLYKSQLKNKNNRYTERVTLRKSFAQSINPVFGKLGALHLGKSTLEQYATLLGFNREIAFEIPTTTSRLFVKEVPYHQAEIASGFNRETTISALHGAMISAAILNGGKMIEPTIVEQVSDSNGRRLYVGQPIKAEQSMNADTSDSVMDLMTATVKNGTGRKAFRGHQRDKILSRLLIGGKTGSIDNKTHDARFDWFVGFGQERGGNDMLAVSVLVAHHKYIGTRAARYARMLLRRYFERVFTAQDLTDSSISHKG